MQQSDDNYWDKYINSFNMNYIPKKEKAVSQREDDELKGAKLVSGDYVYVPRRRLIGFCHCDLHKGYVTKSIYRNHKCGEKQCVFFQKFEDCPFWAAEKGYKRYKNLSSAQKAKIKSEEEKHIIVFYLSDRPYNDFYRFLDLSRTFGFYRSAYVELRHVKDINGNYALM